MGCKIPSPTPRCIYRAKNVPFSSSESDESDAIPREDGRSSSSSDEDSG